MPQYKSAEEKEAQLYAGAKKNPDGSLDLSQAAIFRPKERAEQNGAKQESGLTAEQSKSVSDNSEKIKALFKALEKGGGSLEIQEAKLKVRDLTEQLEMFKKDPNTSGDIETIGWFEREITLNRRVADGEKLMDVLNSLRTKEDIERVEEARIRLKNMKQL